MGSGKEGYIYDGRRGVLAFGQAWRDKFLAWDDWSDVDRVSVPFPVATFRHRMAEEDNR